MPVEPIDPLDAWLGGGDEEEEEGAVGRFSSESAYQYNAIKEFLQNQLGMSASMAGSFANTQGQAFYDANGRFPQAWELLTSGDFIAAANRMPTGADLLPPAYRVWTDTGYQYWVNTPDSGPVPVEIGDPRLGFQIPGNVNPNDPTDLAGNVPIFTPEQVAAIMGSRAPTPTGGGGGGGGRAAPVFDRATIVESVQSMWRYLLWDDPRDPDAIAGDYIADASAFARKGGSLGLEAWLRQRIRTEPRYAMLYRDKPAHIDEDAWLSRYGNVAEGAGLRTSQVKREVVKGATQGQSLGGFQERVSKLPTVQAAQGRFSQKIANTVNQLGALGRA